MELRLLFNDKLNYLKAKKIFQYNSIYVADFIDKQRTILIDAGTNVSAAALVKKEVQDELTHYNVDGFTCVFKKGDVTMESKKVKMKTLIERIVEKVLAKKLNESVKPKRRLRESEESFTVNDLEDHIYNNLPEIKREMKDYGWEIDDIGKMRNYIDFANLLCIDSRKVKDVELKMYAEIAMDIIRQNIDEN